MENRPHRQIVLHPNEHELIMIIRHMVRFGKVEIITKDGLPFHVERRIERTSCTVDNGPFDDQGEAVTMK